MTAGLYVNGRRPASKKAVKEAVTTGGRVSVENTSLFGDGFSGDIAGLAVGQSVTFVGPSPHERCFFGTITRTAKGLRVT